MYELHSADDVDGLVSFSTAVFARSDTDAVVAQHVDETARAHLRSAIADGFTDALVMPSTAWQQTHFSGLVETFTTKEGWSPALISVDGLVPKGRPAGGYVLLLRPDARSDDDLRGLTAPALRKALGEDGCLTVHEYVVAQRVMFERFGDHRFDNYTADPSGWMWLADSTDGVLTAMGYWNGGKHRIEVSACKTGSKNPRKGARRCRIVPLEAR